MVVGNVCLTEPRPQALSVTIRPARSSAWKHLPDVSAHASGHTWPKEIQPLPVGEGLWSRYFVVTDGIETEPPVISRANCPTADTLRESRLCQQYSSKVRRSEAAFGVMWALPVLRSSAQCPVGDSLARVRDEAGRCYGQDSSRGEHGRTLVAASLLTDLLTEVSEPRNGKGRTPSPEYGFGPRPTPRKG
jgi:hypothetical protein